MKKSGLLLLGLLLVVFIVVFLNLKQRKAMVKNMNTSLNIPIKNSEELPVAVKNQIEENLKQSNSEQDKNMPNE
ncbi:MAG: hypothetical protein H7281_00475 [Bacteriovorax sp.]|nr:hypothetical protein [Bacteriovorax sp.]